ncbi:MAG TPA: TIGR00730 family Rossman fold protein [Bauldia sp.]|nr:TIGR00730 family Rossman fold protein [Bauldia sp.]
MTELTSICVYCGSNAGNDPVFAEAAEELGLSMARAGVRLVYGGGSVGLMGIVARAVLDNGGNVTGIIPQFLKDREVMLKEVPDLVVTADMHERKRIMFERSDAFLALPGGIGTLEEVVEIMTWAQLGRHAKPILIANLNGFWDPLVGLFRRMTEAGFLAKTFLGDHPALPVHFVTRIADVIPTIEKALAGKPQAALETNGARLM